MILFLFEILYDEKDKTSKQALSTLNVVAKGGNF